MSIRKTVLTMWLALAALVFVGQTSEAGRDEVPLLFEWELVPTVLPKTPGVVDLRFSFTPTRHCRECSTAVMSVTTRGGLEFLGPQTWTMAVEQGVKYTDVISVNVQPNDTCGIRITMTAPGLDRINAVAWFVTFKDSIEFWQGDPRGYVKPGPTHADRMRARMTPEQLKEMVTVQFDLRSAHKLLVKKVANLVGEMKPTDVDSVFTVTVSRDVLISLYNLHISATIIEQPTPQPDSGSSPGENVDSLKQQGLLDGLRKTKGVGAFAMAGVYPLTPEGKLPTGVDITLYIHILNNTNYNIAGMTNGFEVYDRAGRSGPVGKEVAMAG